MTASWHGKVAFSEADAKPGHYYVTIRDQRGRVSYALGPFTQPKLGQNAHAQALGRVASVRRYVNREYQMGCWWEYGTARIDLCGSPPLGKLNNVLLAKRSPRS